MKQCIFILFVTVSILVSGCSSTRIQKSQINPEEIKSLFLVPPVSNIYYIEKGNSGEYNDSLSSLSQGLIGQTVKGMRDILPLEGELQPSDQYQKLHVTDEVRSFFLMVTEGQWEISELGIPPLVKSLLEDAGQRFGLLIWSNGFTRRKGNYRGQAWKSVLIGVLTMGNYYEVPEKAGSDVYVMIVDTEENGIAFYNYLIYTNTDPLDEAALQRQLRRIFKSYFY